ncbi:MAG: type II secretion system protein [Tepidisphaeraceae bacterium]
MKSALRNKSGFTLVELLVVVGIIALLVSILLPTTTRARQQARAAACASNLQQIGQAVAAYLIDSKGVLHVPPDRWQWVTSTAPTKLISNVDKNAYWGVAYLPYVASKSIYSETGDVKATVYAAARKVFNCPDGGQMDTAFSNTDPATPGHYGINFIITGKTKSDQWAKASRYKRASETIFCHDAAEHRLDGSITYNPDTAGDMLSSFGGTAGNLLEWRPGGEAVIRDFNAGTDGTREYYRHLGKCQVLWLDGHVSAIARSDGSDVPAAWYWGGPAKP